MKRREFITLAGGAAAWPVVARAQAFAPRVGLLSIGTDPERPVFWTPFFERMREFGYEDGRSVAYVRGFAAGRADRIDAIVREVVAARPALLVVTGQVEALAVQRASPSIPCVMILAQDPIGDGLVPSLARPGGRFTGLSMMDLEMDNKRIQLLRTAVPDLLRVQLLTTGSRTSLSPRITSWAQQLHSSASALGVTLEIVQADAPDGIERAIVQAAATGVRGLLVSFDAGYAAHRQAIVDAAIRHRIPVIYGARNFVVDGGLMSYSAEVSGLFRHAADFVDRILRGTDPATLPVEQPTKFEFVLNLKTAKALGLEIPDQVLAITDEVIE
jgi:putative tryptophan/tyrosine transport system substrate-binding protein